MRHRMRGRKLGRNASHRKAMFRNMAVSLIRSVRVDEDDPQRPKVAGRIVTTVPKAKELRPFVEKLVTLARNSKTHEEKASGFATDAERNTDEWKTWRNSDQWNQWNQAIAPAIAARRRAFSILRDHQAVDILFDELAERFEDRKGGYTRVIRLAKVRLGDAGAQALIEFVGDPERDRVRRKRQAPAVADDTTAAAPPAEATDAAADEESTEPEAAAEESADDATAPEAESSEDSADDEGETKESS